METDGITTVRTHRQDQIEFPTVQKTWVVAICVTLWVIVVKRWEQKDLQEKITEP